jgi:hypothetical protein
MNASRKVSTKVSKTKISKFKPKMPTRITRSKKAMEAIEESVSAR